MSGCYDKGLRCLAVEIAKELGVAGFLQEGVYALVGGPNFETIAEARLLHRLGVDAVGTFITDTFLPCSGIVWVVTGASKFKIHPLQRRKKF